MKTTMKSVFGLIVCLMLMPMTALAGSTTTYETFSLVAKNTDLGITGPIVNATAEFNNNNVVIFTFTGLYDGLSANTQVSRYSMNDVGLNLKTALSVLSPGILTTPPLVRVTDTNIDGVGEYNYIFSGQSPGSSTNSGYSGSVKDLELTLTWAESLKFNTLDDIILRNSAGYFAAAHIYNSALNDSDRITGFAVAKNYASTPIPAAAWLLGSGLLGLLGIKRRVKS